MPRARTRQPDPNTDHVAALADFLGSLSDTDFDRIWPSVQERLNDHSIAMLERVLGERNAAGWRADPWTLARHIEGHDVVADWHVARYLAGKFRAAVTGEGARIQVWNQPAQTGKTMSLRRGIVWALDYDPTLPLIYLSYGATLASESAIFVRDIALAHADRLRFQLRPDLRRANRWATDQGGGMLATGIGGSVSGFPAKGVIIDDPLKNWQAAHSPTQRDAVWNEIASVARLRLAEGGFLIVAHTRWHLEDPTGKLHKLADEMGVEVEFISLPMFAVDNDPLGRQRGEVLEPKRYSVEEATSRATFLGSYLTAAMEQQDPQPEQGGELQRSWWQWETRLPEPDEADAWLSSWDCKLKDKESGDYVVGQVWARVGPGFWCTDQLRGQFSLQQTKVAIALTVHRHPHVTTHVVENTGNGPEVMEQLGSTDALFVLTDDMCSAVGVAEHERDAVAAIVRRGVPGLVPQNVNQNKIVRVRTVAPFIETGHVHLPEGKAWAHALVDEAAAFPPSGGGHDDMVDAMSQGIMRLRLMEARVNVPTGALTSPSPSARAVGSISSLLPNRR